MVGITKWPKTAENLWTRLVEYIADDFLLRGAALGLQDRDGSHPAELPLTYLVEKARQEWDQAKTLFNEAADPELIDHAIYALDAAERKYIYLLKKAREERIVDESLYNVQRNGLA